MANKRFSSANHYLYLTTYDDVTFALEGEPDGDFIAIAYDNDTVSAVEGAKGDVQWSQRVASLGTITATNQWGSNWNDRMHKVFKDQQDGNYLKRAEVKRITNTENTLIAEGLEPTIVKTPDYNIGTVAADRAWSIKVKNLKFQETEDPA